MFVMTAKLSKPKLIAAGVLLIAAIALLVLLLSGGQEQPSTLPKGGSDAERAAYLASFGWSINAQPKETIRVKIPDTGDNKVFARYNDLQLSQGFDLRSYGGKEVTRFVYEILNYPESQSPVYAGLLVHEGRIIGGEITDTAPEGVMHGFRKPGSSPSPGEGTGNTAPTEGTANTSPTGSADNAASTESSANPAPTEDAAQSNPGESTASGGNSRSSENTQPTEGNEPS